MSARHLLILGGTGEATALATRALLLFCDGMMVTTALAGRTRPQFDPSESDSRKRRRASWCTVSKASEDLPEPEIPTTAVTPGPMSTSTSQD